MKKKNLWAWACCLRLLHNLSILIFCVISPWEYYLQNCKNADSCQLPVEQTCYLTKKFKNEWASQHLLILKNCWQHFLGYINSYSIFWLKGHPEALKGQIANKGQEGIVLKIW